MEYQQCAHFAFLFKWRPHPAGASVHRGSYRLDRSLARSLTHDATDLMQNTHLNVFSRYHRGSSLSVCSPCGRQAKQSSFGPKCADYLKASEQHYSSNSAPVTLFCRCLAARFKHLWRSFFFSDSASRVTCSGFIFPLDKNLLNTRKCSYNVGNVHATSSGPARWPPWGAVGGGVRGHASHTGLRRCAQVNELITNEWIWSAIGYQAMWFQQRSQEVYRLCLNPEYKLCVRFM